MQFCLLEAVDDRAGRRGLAINAQTMQTAVETCVWALAGVRPEESLSQRASSEPTAMRS